MIRLKLSEDFPEHPVLENMCEFQIFIPIQVDPHRWKIFGRKHGSE
jgi:hypothetical protein